MHGDQTPVCTNVNRSVSVSYPTFEWNYSGYVNPSIDNAEPATSNELSPILSTRLLSLPYELIREIILLLQRKKDVSAVSRTSQRLQVIGNEVLYAEFELRESMIFRTHERPADKIKFEAFRKYGANIR